MAGTAKLVHDIPIIMTRPKGSNQPFIDSFAPDLRKRLAVVESPLVEIVGLGRTVVLGPNDAAIFTSANGVRFAPEGERRVAYCVGARTTSAAQASGWRAERAGEDAADVLAFLLSRRPPCLLHHLSGVHQRGNITEGLEQAGLISRRTEIYEQTLRPLSEAALQVVAAMSVYFVPLFSPRTAKHFASLVAPSSYMRIVALSEAVATECSASGLPVLDVAQRPNANAMVKCLEKHLRNISLG